jgi:hypothetical protein
MSISGRFPSVHRGYWPLGRVKRSRGRPSRPAALASPSGRYGDGRRRACFIDQLDRAPAFQAGTDRPGSSLVVVFPIILLVVVATRDESLCRVPPFVAKRGKRWRLASPGELCGAEPLRKAALQASCSRRSAGRRRLVSDGRSDRAARAQPRPAAPWRARSPADWEAFRFKSPRPHVNRAAQQTDAVGAGRSGFGLLAHGG